MWHVVPLIIWNALSLACYSGTFVTMMTRTMKTNHPEWGENDCNSMALYAMITLGIGEIVGCMA